MIDKSRDKNKKGTLPDFAPVPRLCNRHDGWTAERQRGFVEGLADLGSVRAAANAVNMTPESAYQLRRHPRAGEFRKAWEDALKCGVQQLEDIAMDRARYGIEVPVFHAGEVVGQRRVYNDALLMFLLRNCAPKRFSADSWQKTDAATHGQLKRLREQWRKEWEDERAEEHHKTAPEFRDRMNARLEVLRNGWLESMSAKTRAAYDALMEAQREDDEARWAEEQRRWKHEARLVRHSSAPSRHALPFACSPTSERTGKRILEAPWDDVPGEAEEEMKKEGGTRSP